MKAMGRSASGASPMDATACSVGERSSNVRGTAGFGVALGGAGRIDISPVFPLVVSQDVLFF